MTRFVGSKYSPANSLTQEAASSLLTLRQVAAILGVSYETVRRLVVKDREIAYVQRPGCSIRVLSWSLSEYLESYTCHARRNHPASSEDQTGRTGTSETAAMSFRRELRIGRQRSDG